MSGKYVMVVMMGEGEGGEGEGGGGGSGGRKEVEISVKCKVFACLKKPKWYLKKGRWRVGEYCNHHKIMREQVIAAAGGQEELAKRAGTGEGGVWVHEEFERITAEVRKVST